MTNVDLKLKQASAVLGVSAKDLQNLVQLKVINPPRKNSSYRFNRNILLKAKVAFYLKASLGTSSILLARFTGAVFQDLKGSDSRHFRDVWIRSLPYRGSQPVEVKIPMRALAKELDQCIPQAAEFPDLPRGRKRPGWKAEFLNTLAMAGGDLKGVSSKKFSKEIAEYRRLRKKGPEITVIGASRKRRPRGVVDTSVVVAGIAGFKSPEGGRRNASASFLRRWLDNDTFTWLITEEILTEYKEVLRRLGVRRPLIGAIVNYLREEAELTTVSNRTGLSPDPGDDPFLCCAEEGNADFVVTLNPRDFPQPLLRAKVINPSDIIPARAKRPIRP